jgi:predicted acylesterase/phospholipase RssA
MKMSTPLSQPSTEPHQRVQPRAPDHQARGGAIDDQPAPNDVFVLSGGAARGAVQAGMMQALAEAGILPCGLVGTSVGALNAAFMG